MKFRVSPRWPATILAVAAALWGCGGQFDRPSYIDSQRFLAIVADPLEASPGQAITFSAVVTNPDGSLYSGNIAWLVVANQSDQKDVHLQQHRDEPFVWNVPADPAELAAKFGSPEQDGYLATVTATAFDNGRPTGKPISAFKLFVISDRPPAERLSNPTIVQFNVFANGQPLTPGMGYLYESDAPTAALQAVPADASGVLAYSWFSTTKEFSPSFGPEQKLAPGGRGPYPVYCVLRRAFYFYHNASARTRVTGEDWRRVEVQFTGN